MSPQAAPAADDTPENDPRRWLSGAVDGDVEGLDKACRAWRDDPQARATWHSYHLIGDVMRSSELAAAPSHDARFLAQLRERLADEPVVLAPSAPKRAAPAWRMPAAVAAGFVLVAGMLVVSQVSGPEIDGAADTLAAAGSVPSGVVQVSNAAGRAAAPTAAGALIRDARLDEFLRAHQSARGGFAAAVPGSALRRVDAEMPAGAPR
ncbi:MAG: RseA family anti-sigma factor [Rubrivivax sp.]|nr:RseA family anti-sigma factor [Rubrivivax sp.]